MFHPRRTLRALLPPLVAGLTLTALPAPAATAAPALTNAGFESGGTGAATPAGWSESGDTAASYTEAGGRDGGHRLAHWSSSAYRVETYQQLTGLAAGDYRLTAWVRSGGGQNAAYLALRDCGGAEQRTGLPVSDSGWLRIVVPVTVSGGRCTVAVVSDANAGELDQRRRPHLRTRHRGPGRQGRRHLLPAQERGPRRGVPHGLRNHAATPSPSSAPPA